MKPVLRLLLCLLTLFVRANAGAVCVPSGNEVPPILRDSSDRMYRYEDTARPRFAYDSHQQLVRKRMWANSAWPGTVAPWRSAVRHHRNSKFTGKERDWETQGLDYFGARYYAGAMGRFTNADAPFADQQPGDPQSWNLYA